MLFEWKDEYSVGVAQIDQQHRRMFAMINDLYEAMEDGAGSAILKPLLYAVKDYTESHFEIEEQSMAEVGYPGLESHREEHRVMAHKVDELIAGLNNGGIALSVKTLLLLRGWLEEHICGTDMKMAPHLVARVKT